jgi:hypothetical protein
VPFDFYRRAGLLEKYVNPTPFEWGGARAARRERNRQRSSALGGSDACVRRSFRPKLNLIQKWHHSCQLTH